MSGKIKKSIIQGSSAMNASEINKRLRVNLSISFIEDVLGVKADMKTSTHALWYEHRFNNICYALSQHAFCMSMSYQDE